MNPFPPSVHSQLKDCWTESLWDSLTVGSKIDVDYNHGRDVLITLVDDDVTLH